MPSKKKRGFGTDFSLNWIWLFRIGRGNCPFAGGTDPLVSYILLRTPAHGGSCTRASKHIPLQA
jgi:hypothetical protein